MCYPRLVHGTYISLDLYDLLFRVWQSFEANRRVYFGYAKPGEVQPRTWSMHTHEWKPLDRKTATLYPVDFSYELYQDAKHEFKLLFPERARWVFGRRQTARTKAPNA